MVNETSDSVEFGTEETAVVETKRATIGITEDTKQILVELKSIYMLPDWESAVLFLIKNMKKVPRPKSEYFD